MLAGTEYARAPAPTLGQMMVEAGLLSPEQVAVSQEAAQRERIPLGQLVVRDGLVAPRDLATLTALELGLTMVDLRSQTIDPRAVATLPEELARRYMVLPISREAGRLTVAMGDPIDLYTIQDLTARTGDPIEPVVATFGDILEHIEISYRLTEDPETPGTGDGAQHFRRVTASTIIGASPARTIDMLLQQAVQDRASDIHVQPTESRLRVRFRIDGILHDTLNLPTESHPTLVSRVKIMAGMNIAERRRPQDGQFTVIVGERKVDVRASVSNTVDGEMVVLRLLDKQFTLLGVDQLGLSPATQESYRRLLKLPYGLVVVCGPTGAGKSTSLYASILQMNRMEQNVISLEDPVEYRITDVSQMQVHPEAGVTFATQLRSILRLDPDAILVGEIRDQETALIATQAALTGHLVLTSLHANDAVSALMRLQDLGVAPYLITSSLAGILAQRMVRVVCDGCKTMMPRPLAEQREYAFEMGEVKERFLYGSGCNVCAQTGYLGRTGVFEVLPISDNLRQLFLEDAPRHRLSAQALDEGMTPMRRDGMLKVQDGITTPYEVMRVLFTLE